MTDQPPADALTFDMPAAPPAAACRFCQNAIVDQYFTVNGQVACERCSAAVSRHQAGGAGLVGVATGIGLGSAAGLIGAIAWWAIRRFASLEIGLIAIGIGHFVGQGVRRGSGGRGGRGYQVLAVLLTYFWITANYVPDIVQAVLSHDEATTADAGMAGHTPSAATPSTDTATEAPAAPSAGNAVVGIAFVVGLAMAAPFLGGASNVIGLLIISFGLWQAWKLNAAEPVSVDGPFRLRATDPSPVPGA